MKKNLTFDRMWPLEITIAAFCLSLGMGKMLAPFLTARADNKTKKES